MTSQVCRVGDIAEQIRGVTYKKQDASSKSRPGYLPVLRAGNITDSGVTYDNLLFVPESKVAERQKPRRNDILIAASSGSLEVVGKAARLLEDFEGGFGAFCKVLRLHKDVDPAYFAQYFKSPGYRRTVSFLAAGANINNLRNRDLDNLEIPLPSLPEQKRIAAILDSADALRAKRRETLTQLDTLLQSTFLEMFGDPVTNPKGWEVAKLGHVSSFFAGSTLPDGVPFSGQEGGFLCLKVSDLNSPDNSTTVFSSKLWTENRGKGIAAPANSVVIPKRGGAIGTNKKRILSRAAVLDPNLMAIGAAESLEPLYLYHWFFTFDLLDITSGSSVPQLNKRDLTPLPIPVPPADLQARFATIVQSVEQQKSRLRTHLDELDTLFASLQARAFAGEM